MSLRYVSTRGGVPPCGFEAALFAGLAADGGLYLPERWPRLERDELEALQGASYQEVAARVLAPFVGDDLRAAELRELIEAAYAGFDHAAIAPLRQLGPNEWLLELFHGPTLAFKDVAMQLLGRLFEHFLAAARRAITIVGATSGDTGAAAIEAFAGRARTTIVILHPHGRISEVQRRQMTTVTAANVHNLAIEGTFDDCQALLKALLGDAALARAAQPRRDQLDQLGPDHGPGGLLRDRGARARRALAPGRLRRADRQFRRRLRRLRRASDGPADRAADRRDQPQRHPGALLRDRRLPRGRGRADHEPEHGHPGREQLRAPAVRPVRRRRRRGRAPDGRVRRARGACASPDDALGRARELFDAARVDEDETAATMAEVLRATGQLIDPHTAVGVAAGRALPARSEASPLIALATAHPAKFPDAVRRGDRHPAAAAARASPICSSAPERCAVLPNDLAAVQRAHRAAGHGDRMSETTRDHDPRQRPAGRDRDHGERPDRERRRLGRRRRPLRGGRGQRRRPHARAHGVQGHRAPLGARDRRGDRERRRPAQRLHLARAHRLLRARPGRRSAARGRPAGRHPAALGLRRGRARARARRDPAGDRPGPGHAGRSGVRSVPGDRVSRASRSGARSSARPSSSRRCRAPRWSTTWRTTTGPRAWCWRPPARSSTSAWSSSAERLFRELPAPAPHAAEPARYEGGERREERELEQAHLLLGLPAFSYLDDDFYALQVLSTMLGGGMSSRLFQEVRENRGLAYSVFSFASSYADTGLLGIYAGTGEKETAELVPVVCDELLELIEQPGEEELVRARAQLKASLMMALESCFAQSEELARQLLIFGRRIPQDEIIAKVDAVDQAAIRRVGRRLLQRRPDPRRDRPARQPARPRLHPPPAAVTDEERGRLTTIRRSGCVPSETEAPRGLAVQRAWRTLRRVLREI